MRSVRACSAASTCASGWPADPTTRQVVVVATVVVVVVVVVEVLVVVVGFTVTGGGTVVVVTGTEVVVDDELDVVVEFGVGTLNGGVRSASVCSSGESDSYFVSHCWAVKEGGS